MTEVTLEPARLLLKAVDALPAAERDAVLLWLLERGLGAEAGRPAWQPFVSLPSSLEPAGFRSARASAGGGEMQMVPVRFPADQHVRLRGWCTEHNFSMATVVRGLVERFLDEQTA